MLFLSAFVISTVLTVISIFLCQANQNEKGGSRKVAIVVPCIVSSVIAMIVIFSFVYWRTKTKFGGKGKFS